MQIRVFLALSGAALCAGQTVVELARRAPPELFANAAITLVERGQAPDANQQRALLEEALDAAGHARQPVPLVRMPGSADSRAELRESAAALQLDGLSLETRIIALAARTDAANARAMFEKIRLPLLQARPCEDPMIASVAPYYQMAASVAPGDLLPAIAQASSPDAIASAAAALARLNDLPADQFRLLAGALALKFQTAAPDYRSFGMNAGQLETALDALSAAAREKSVAIDDLRAGVRKFVITQLSSPHCIEKMPSAAAFVDWFNRGFHGKADAIETPEIVAPSDLGNARSLIYFESSAGKEISDKFQSLKQARGAPQWSSRLAEFLKDLDAWKPDGDKIDAFHQRITVLHGLYQLVPAGQERDAMLQRIVELLKSGDIEREYSAEWLLQVNSIATVPAGEKAVLLKAFRESGDAGLQLFAAMQ